MQTVIIVIYLMIVVAMIGLVLLQRSEGGGLGIGGGGGFLTSRGQSNVLTKTTATLAAVFFTTSLVLSVLAGWERKPHSILNSGAPAAACSTNCGRPSSRVRRALRARRGRNSAAGGNITILKFLPPWRHTRVGISNQKQQWNHKLGIASSIPTFA